MRLFLPLLYKGSQPPHEAIHRFDFTLLNFIAWNFYRTAIISKLENDIFNISPHILEPISALTVFRQIDFLSVGQQKRGFYELLG